MEILIIGILVVALMIYVSTRIKQSAREAYEQEVFENEQFILVKPEGFIIPFNEKSPHLFETYSKDFGDEEARKLNQCWATIDLKNGFKRNSSTKGKKTENGVLIHTFTKTVGNKSANKTYELEVSVLDKYKETFDDKITKILNSFAIK